MSMDRRRFLLGSLFAAAACATPGRAQASSGLGPLQRGGGPLDLPEGFSATVLQRAGEPMTDGFTVPVRPDGMACFDVDGAWVLLRNHEVFGGTGGGWSRRAIPAEAYDKRAAGGVSRLVIDPATLAVRSSNLVLTGTHVNCAGGPSPWGWLSCEESEERDHGYAFRCPTTADRLQPPERLTSWGRFKREAVAVDPATHTVWMTEDHADSCFYRFVPKSKAEPFGEGTLQAMVVTGRPAFDTTELRPGEPVKVSWIDVPDPQARTAKTRQQGRDAGAARVRRGEGLWFRDGRVVFTATIGGRAGLGQVLVYRPADETLEVLAEATDPGTLAMPDNVTIAPWGDVVVAEDSGNRQQHLRGITATGEVYDIARNAVSSSELAGVCFSPDGGTLFVNLQKDGLTVAVRGPWPS